MESWMLLYLPFELMGRFLRMLSLSGAAGNGVAWLVYVFSALLPVAAGAVWLKRKREGWTSLELLLVLLSAYSFYLLFLFINPHLFYEETGAVREMQGRRAELLPVLKCFSVSLWYILLVGYVLLRLLRKLQKEEILEQKGYLYRGLSSLLFCSLIVYGLGSVGGGALGFIEGIQKLKENEAAGNLDYLFAGLRMALTLAPQLCFLGVLWQGRILLGGLERGPFEASTLEAARKLSRTAVRMVQMSVFSALIWNGSLFLFRTSLVQVDYEVRFSLFPLLLAFGALIFTEYIQKAGELKQENELFV